MKQFVAAAAIAVASAMACVGCGESASVGNVSGKVTIDGQPVAAGSTVFFEQSRHGVIAAGIIEDGGAYTLNYQGSPGIPPGDYVVFVGPPDSNMSQQEFYALKKKVDAEFRSRGEQPPPSPDWTLPAKYYQSSTSPLRERVEVGENTVNLALKR